MVDRNRASGGRQASPADERPLKLARLFILHPSGEVQPVDLAPLRTCVEAAQIELEGLCYAAEDAIRPDPRMTVEAQRADVVRRGAAVAAYLTALLAEIDVLDGSSRQEVRRVA